MHTKAATSPEARPGMPKSDMDGSASRRKGSDKARRNFELNGQYSAKHLRLKAEAHAQREAAGSAAQKTARRKGR